MFLTRGIIFTGVTLKTMQEKFLPFVGVVTVLFFLSPVLVGAADTPQLNVKIGNTGASAIFKAVSCTGGYCTIGWIGDYIGAVYRYGVALAAALAMLMITIGGAVWLTAGGSPERGSTAKSFIISAVVGLVIALFSYNILYTVNPALTELKPLKIPEVENIRLAQAGDPSTDALVGKIACETSTRTISYDSVGLPQQTPDVLADDLSPLPTLEETNLAPSRLGALAVPSGCRDYNFDGYGVDSRILRAIASTESGCNPSARGEDGECGMMQMLPTTADRDCDYLLDHPQESIELAARYIQQNEAFHEGNISHILAGYNGGYGTTPRNGKRPPLAPSVDCPGFRAYECCINPGGLESNQGYVIRAMRYYQGAQDNQYQ